MYKNTLCTSKVTKVVVKPYCFFEAAARVSKYGTQKNGYSRALNASYNLLLLVSF